MSKYYFQRHFTLAEANALLPFLKDSFKKIHWMQEELIGKFPEMSAILERKVTDGGFANSVEYLESSAEITRVIKDILKTGAELKDLSRGLVDFPHLSEGKEVLLCWQLGEEKLLFWHGLEAGYAGRQPLYLDLRK